MNEPRDTLVGDALRRLDVPDHAPGFWGRLDAELADRQTADGHQPDADDVDHGHDADVIDLGSAPGLRRPRSRSTRRQAVAAAAAAAVAAIALTVGLPAVQQAEDGDSQVDSADIPDATAPDPAPPVTSAPETTAPAPPAQQDPEELAIEWLTLLREGEHESAHAMLDDTSQDALPLDTFLDVATGLAEGAAAFAARARRLTHGRRDVGDHRRVRTGAHRRRCGHRDPRRRGERRPGHPHGRDRLDRGRSLHGPCVHRGGALSALGRRGPRR